jgi:hemoglobin
MADTIFERYGGFAKVSRVVSAFYQRVLASPIISGYFADIDMRSLIDHQTKFIATIMGGPASFSNEHLARVHAPKGIDDAAFEEMAALMRETLDDFDFDESDIATVIGEIIARRPFIVTQGHTHEGTDA